MANLKTLIGCYFHQDWDLEALSSDEVLEKYKQDTNPVDVQGVVAEIDELLASQKSEDELQELLLRKLGAAYYFPADGYSASTWLQHIRAKLSEGKR